MAEDVDTAVAAPGAAAELLPARQVDLWRAARIGPVGGLVAVFIAVNGMVSTFSERLILASISLAYLALGGIPFLFGYLAGRPPPVLQGFATPRGGWRNPTAGAITGLAIGVVLAAFVIFIAAVNIRGVFINVSPDLVRQGPRLLTFNQGVGPGIGLIVAFNLGLGIVGGGLHLLGRRWRRAVFAAALWVLGFGLMASFVGQILRGIQDTLRLWTAPIADFLYEPSGALRVAGAITVGVVGFGLSVLSTRQRRRPVRERFERLPERSRRLGRLMILVLVLLVLGLLPQLLGPFLTEVLNIAAIFLLMALGLNIVLGLAGLLDLGYVAFFAVGAYTTAVLISPQSSLGLGWIFWAAIPFVVLTATVAGLLVGTPVLRMRGDYLAIVTLGFGEIARLLFLSDWFKPTFGGAQGITRIPPITVGPFVARDPQLFFYAVFVFILLAAYATYALQASRVGRAWMAMREDESVAEAMGVNIVAAKLSAFVIGAILAGVGGALFATKIGSVFPHSFNVIVSITVLVVIIVGGMASVPGVVLGAFVLVGLPEFLREFEEYRFLLYGALLIFMMLRRPEGFIPSRRRARELHEEEVAQDEWLRPEAAEGAAGPASDGRTDR
ncbi:MAG: leucine/isoleucine/valine transporter permease subunit [Streptosporangiales bacterium]|nr:leucine/isoleucine/valine transporter permease subunit [Streptosporangiales bacterium]